MEPYAHKYWAPDEPTLTLTGGGSTRQVPCFYIPTSKFTPKKGITAEMVYMCTGDTLDDADITGKIVVFDQVFGTFPPKALSRVRRYAHRIGELGPVDMGPPPWNRLNFNAVAKAVETRGGVGLVGLLSQMPYDTDRYYAPYEGY